LDETVTLCNDDTRSVTMTMSPPSCHVINDVSLSFSRSHVSAWTRPARRDTPPPELYPGDGTHRGCHSNGIRIQFLDLTFSFRSLLHSLETNLWLSRPVEKPWNFAAVDLIFRHICFHAKDKRFHKRDLSFSMLHFISNLHCAR